MPKKSIFARDVGEAVERIVPYLEDTSSSAHKSIYFDGWNGLGAPAVLRAIAQDPPPSLMKKFDKIIHLDCSRWKSRRALQRTIAQELKLPQDRVMAIFDRQDEDDDFTGVDESSRGEIRVIGAEIHRVLQGHTCLVLFHNGSNNVVDLNDFGIPQWVWFGTKVLWTFRGRLRLNAVISRKVDHSHLYLYEYYMVFSRCKFWLEEEAKEIARYTCELGVTSEIAEKCCLYLLSLHYEGGTIMNYNWVRHASNYWVCDGIIQGGQFDQAWEAAVALHQQIQLEDYSSNTLPGFGSYLQTPPKRWIFATKSTVEDNVTLPQEATSFFLVDQSESDPPLPSLPNRMFHQSDMLRVLRLCRCTFNFSSPPFHCCRNLRFLGLDLCKDQPQGEDEKKEIPEMEFFQSLWVVDISNTDWELTSSLEITERMAANIREVYIKKGRFWHHNFAWRQLQNLRKLRVIDPTCPRETREMDEFTDMVKLELLDLSKNSTIQVLPSLSGATSLKTLVLDGCVGLKHVAGLPPSLESFSLVVGEAEKRYNEAKITHISMAGCARMVDFTLRGSFPRLEELDLSGTKVKTLDLKDHFPCLQRLMLLGCEQLRAVLWPEKGMPQLSVLCIDTRGGGGGDVGRTLPDSKKLTYSHGYVAIMDMRFIQSLVLRRCNGFCWKTDRLNLNICISPTSTDGAQSYNKEKMGPASVRKTIRSPILKSLIPNPFYRAYSDVATENITIDHDYNSAQQFQPSAYHVGIGEGISNINVESVQGIKPIIFVMDKVESLHVHDNSSITIVIPEHMMSIGEYKLRWRHLKRCRVERCPKLHIVFTTNYDIECFPELETFWAADLLMAHCIWSKGRTVDDEDTDTFAKLRSIHLYSCPRLTFVLPLSWFYTLRSLETLHIVNCGDLRQVFPMEAKFLRKIATSYRNGVLEFPTLKQIYLHELHKLQHICEAKMFAPKLEKIRLRGCWSLRRLPAVDQNSRPVVDCEKDWWEKLEWDGLEAGHDPSLFEPHHSSYYKKPLNRVSVLR